MRILDYVIQRHKSKGSAGLHYDFRIKYKDKNMLASWALPKANLPTNPGDKVLAVRTSDHTMDWLSFEGTIPTGNKGAGPVTIVQRGKLELLAWTPKVISFKVEGSHMNGKYALVLFKRGKKPGESLWLLLRSKTQ